MTTASLLADAGYSSESLYSTRLIPSSHHSTCQKKQKSNMTYVLYNSVLGLSVCMYVFPKP